MELIDYRKCSMKFRRLSSNMLNSNYEEGNLHLIRLKQFMDNDEIISKIISERIKNIDFDYKMKKFIDKEDDTYWIQLNIPIDEGQHMKAIYDYLIDITVEEKNIVGIARRFYHKSKSFNDIVRNYLDIVFRPLVNYINECLSEEIMCMDNKNTGQTINQYIGNNYGLNNIADGNITYNNNVSIGLKEDIKSLLSDLSNSIKCENEINDDDKEDILDELDVINEQIYSRTPKIRRIEKSCNRIKEFMSNLPDTLSKSAAIVIGLENLINSLNKFSELMS